MRTSATSEETGDPTGGNGGDQRGRTGLRVLRRIGVGFAGGTVLVAGVALIFLPVPAMLVIPLGLGILATEFAWARRLLQGGKARLARLSARFSPGADTVGNEPRLGGAGLG